MVALIEAPPEEQWRVICSMSASDLLALDADFESWAHESQLPPKTDSWRTWMIMAGRGFGKTRAGAEWVEKIAGSRPGVRIALVGATIDEARRVMVEGVSGVLSVARRRRHRVRWEPSIGRLRWPNGSEAQIFSGDNAEGLRGPEHDFAWCAPTARCACRRSRRRPASQRSAAAADRRFLLYCRKFTEWRMGAMSSARCCLHRRRLAIYRSERRPEDAGQVIWNARRIWLRRMGDRVGSRLASRHRG